MKYISITLGLAELLYDIGNNAYIEGHIMDETSEHARHMVKDAIEDGNVDRILRRLELSHCKVVEALYPWTKADVPVGEEVVPWTDRLRETEEYRLDLRVEQDVSVTTIRLLTSLVHDYLVSECVADWLSITKPEKAQIWAEKASEAMAEIQSVRNHRRRPLRRPVLPM